jgi:hypothetical protein
MGYRCGSQFCLCRAAEMVRLSTLAVGKCVYVESVTATPSVALVNMSSSCCETTSQRKARRRNAVPEQQPVEYRGRRQSGDDDAWVSSEASTDENSEGWPRTTARVIDGVVRSSDLLVHITDTDGKVSRSVPLLGGRRGRSRGIQRLLVDPPRRWQVHYGRPCGAGLLPGIGRQSRPDRPEGLPPGTGT